MSHFRKAFSAVAVLLASLGANASPLTYNYTFGTAAAGNFTTDAAAADAGYFLLTELNITVLNGVSGLLTGDAFQAGAAYNPVTGQFINHSSGNTFNDFGGISVAGNLFPGPLPHLVSPMSFKLGSTSLTIELNSYSGNLAITPVAVGAVPEPASLALVGLGLAAAGFASRRRTA